MLRIVRILILVHQHITELITITRQHIREITEQDISIHQQIIEVHCPGLATSLPVTGINITDSRHFSGHIAFISLFVSGISRRSDQMIFGIGNTCLYDSRLIGLFIQPHFLND